MSSLGTDAKTGAPWPQLDTSAFPGLAGDIVQLIAPETESDPVGILLELLVCFGNAIGRTAFFSVEGSRHYLNLYLALVGTTSGRKGSGWNHARNTMAAVDPTWVENCIQSGLRTGEGLINQVRDPTKKYDPTSDKEIIIDAGVADKRCLFLEQELANVLQSASSRHSSLSIQLRAAWDGENLQTISKTAPACASQPHISVIGHITREELQSSKTQGLIANGFAGRFIWAVVKRSDILLPDGGNLQGIDFSGVNARLSAALDFARHAGDMRRDSGADELWHANYESLTREAPGPVGGLKGRVAPLAMRLACLFALLDQSPLVKHEHLWAGIQLMMFAMKSAHLIFGDTPESRDGTTIFHALEDSWDGLSRTAIRDLFNRNRTAKKIEAALAWLQESGFATMEIRRRFNFNPEERWKARKMSNPASPPSRSSSPTAAPESGLQ